jgi:hypothetical protein
MRYISQDTAKCAGNPHLPECNDCLRMTLPVNPNAQRQVWIGAWVITDEPCPSRWSKAEDATDWSAA